MDKSDKSNLFHRNRITRNLGLNAFKPTFHFQEISSAINHARNELIAGKQIEITPPIEELANFLEKDINKKEEINHWIAKTFLFSYHDYCKAYYTLNDRLDLAKRRDDHPGDHDEDVFAYGVCRGIADTYYKDKNLNSIIPDFEVFIKTRPMDFTRPHGWVNQSYVGIGEYLTALMTPKDMISEKVIEEFRGKFIPGESKNEFVVTYEQYLQSFEEAHSVTQIQPWSIEFCVYYVFQQRLEVKYIFDEPAPLNFPPQGNYQRRPDPRLYMCPSFKYFDVFTLSRYLALWEFWSEIFTHCNFLNSWQVADFISHCSEVFDFSYPNNKTRTSFWRLGIEVKNDCFSFHEQFDHWTSFFGDMFNKICFSILLESQIMALKSDAIRKKKCKTPALENAFLELFDKQRTVNNWIASQKSLDDLTPPRWEYFENYLLDFSKILPITKEHIEITQHYKIPSVAVSSFDLVYKEYLQKYKTRMESSDLICLFTTKEKNKKPPKWDREICALNAMVTISPEKRPDSYRSDIKLSPTKALEGKIKESTSPTKIQATQKEIEELYIQFKDQNILLKAKGLSRE